ncbi:hypothetical protein [Nocardioides daejeonensis]|uniref:hypothetical protein n=1 Tax=Nocardioides daejeonensis TaxID=1046556 RepID=UPI000D7460F5|nr:hypothetical protein [Nocardioides daejeonensis]
MTVLTPATVRRSGAALVATLLGTGLLAAPADAGALTERRAAVSVTIKADGVDLSGKVKSRRTACKVERTVLIYKQFGGRGGGNDHLFATDTTDERGRWNSGNTGQAGKFYAKVRPTAKCRGASSPTVRAVRSN